MYYAEPRTPTAAESDLIRITGNLAAMVIQRHRDAEDLRGSEARHRRLAAELQVARADLQAILDNVPAQITLWDATRANCFANRMAETHFGAAASEIVGKHLHEVIGEEKYRRAKPLIDAALAGEQQSHEQIDVLPDGSLRYSQVEFIPKHENGAVVGLYAFAADVTDVRKSYERIRELAQRLETVREDERRAVARILHEGVAQDLFAMKLGVNQLKAGPADPAAVTRTCQELAESIDKCMGAIRQVANDLQPSALAHLPLSVALREHARYFGEISGLSIGINDGAPDGSLDEATSLVLFRAAQEALANVARHAQASRADIMLRADADMITMDVIDDGIGIEEAALVKAGCLGLLGIRERVGTLGGALAVMKNAGAGTTLSVQIPIALPVDAHARPAHLMRAPASGG
jgi:PAS domain S-box-containing protein